jgi:hypothetical protein
MHSEIKGRVMGNERKAMSKKLRFDVFKRDGFVCQYCGATPPGATLEVDHMHPVSQGGKNSLHNLVTACFDCNRGKGAGLLTTVPESVTAKAELLVEKMAQLKGYQKLLRSARKNEDESIDAVEAVFISYFPESGFTDKFRESVRDFLKSINQYDLSSYIHKACTNGRSKEDCIKYFCGICWNVIKGKGR